MKKKLLSIVLMISMILMFLTAAVPVAVYDKAFFLQEAEKNDVSQNTGMTSAEISSVTDEIVRYLKGERKDFDITVQRQNGTWHLFNEDEQKHMIDVQNLMVFQRTVLYFSLWMSLIIGFLLFRTSRSAFFKALTVGGITGLILLILAAGIAGTDFTEIFIKLHQMIFSNELWLMDPETEILINIVPEPYFIHLAVYAGAVAGFGYLSMIIAGLFGKKHLNTQH